MSSTPWANRSTARARSTRDDRVVEKVAPGVIARKSVDQPVQTGLKSIDSAIPDRPWPARADHRRPPDRQDRGGDRRDHQPEGYPQNGPRPASTSRSARRRSTDQERGARAGTLAPGVHHHRGRYGFGSAACSTSRRSPAARWASTSATAAGRPDHLRRPVQAGRGLPPMSLLLRRPPGREAFPGDVFYLHSRVCSSAPPRERRRSLHR